MERGLSTLDIAFKKEVHQSEKEDDNETLIDELEISPVIRKPENKKYAEAEEEDNAGDEVVGVMLDHVQGGLARRWQPERGQQGLGGE